jgi:predicted alpha/beta-hydrolase family hydrolase
MYLLSERRTPNAERRTPNAERRTPNAERRPANGDQRTATSERRPANGDQRTAVGGLAVRGRSGGGQGAGEVAEQVSGTVVDIRYRPLPHR